jgi:hypothetical protein
MTTAFTLSELTARVLATFPEARRVILFGSRARGASGPGQRLRFARGDPNDTPAGSARCDTP